MANEPFKDWYGFTTDQVIGKASHDIYAKEYADAYVAQDRDVLKSMKMIERERDITFADGSVHPILIIKFPIIGADNQSVGVGTINIDLTESKRAEDALSESERNYRTLFDNDATGIGRTRITDGKILLANSKLADLFGYASVDEFVEEFVSADHYADADGQPPSPPS